MSILFGITMITKATLIPIGIIVGGAIILLANIRIP
jgi:hypothetical protein